MRRHFPRGAEMKPPAHAFVRMRLPQQRERADALQDVIALTLRLRESLGDIELSLAKNIRNRSRDEVEQHRKEADEIDELPDGHRNSERTRAAFGSLHQKQDGPEASAHATSLRPRIFSASSRANLRESWGRFCDNR